MCPHHGHKTWVWTRNPKHQWGNHKTAGQGELVWVFVLFWLGMAGVREKSGKTEKWERQEARGKGRGRRNTERN